MMDPSINRHLAMSRILVVLLLVIATADDARAQAIPDHIPDAPEERPGERVQKRLAERHRPQLARFFVATDVAGAVPGTPVAGTFELTATGGISKPNGDALYLGIGTRFVPPHVAGRDRLTDRIQSQVLSTGYEVAMWRVRPNDRFWRDARLGLGAAIGVGMITDLRLEVRPTYMLRVSRWWSMPISVSLGTSVLRDSHVSMSRFMVGVSIGARMNLLSRERPYLK